MSSNDKNSAKKSDGKEDKELEPKSPEPSHVMTGQYAVLMETSEKECESWYYFIRLAGNGPALRHLQEQLVTGFGEPTK